MTRDWEAAAREGDAQALAEQLAAGADIDALDRYGETALMLACLAGSLSAVRFLIRANANLDKTAKYNLSASMLAVINGHEAIVRALAGADLTLQSSGAPGFHNKTVADLARARGLKSLASDLAN